MPDDAPHPETTPRRKRRILRVLGISVAALVLLLVLFVAALHTPPARRFVLSQVTRLLTAQQIELRTDELRYNLLDLSLDLRNVRVGSTALAGAPPILEASRVRADLSLTQLLRGRYVLESGLAEGVKVHYFVDEQGRDNLPHPPTSDEPAGEPVDYLLADVAVPGALVRVEDRSQDVDVTLPVSNLSVRGNALTDRQQVVLDAGGGTARYQDRNLRIDRLAGRIDLGKDDLNVEALGLEVDGVNATVEGALRDFDALQADVTLHATVDATRVAPLAGVTDPVGGMVQIDARAQGPVDGLAVDATVAGTDLRFRNIQNVDVNATGAYDLAREQGRVTDLQVTAPWGAVRAEGAVATDAATTSRVAATIEGLDAAALMGALELPYLVATRVDAKVNASWPGLEYRQASGDAAATLTATRAAAAKSVVPVAGRLTVSGREGDFTADVTDVRAAGASVTGTVRVADLERIDGRVQLSAADIGRTVAAAEGILGRPSGSLLPTPVTGSLRVDSTIGGTIEAPTAVATIAAPNVAAGEAVGIALNGVVAYEPDLVTVRNADIAWGEARAHASGRVELAGAQRLSLALGVDALQVTEVTAAAGQGDLPVSGVASLTGTVSGTIERPVVSADLRAANLAAYGETIGQLTATVGLDGRDVVLRALALEKPQEDGVGRLTATGSYHLDRQAYTFTLDSDNLRLTSLTLPDGRRVAGEVTLDASGAGTTSDPAGTIQAAVAGLEVGDMALGRVALDGRVANRQATFTTSAEQFAVRADGTIGTEAPYPATITAQVSDLDLTALPIELDTPLTGTVRATLNAEGNLDDPTKGRAAATIERFQGAWNGQPFGVDGPAEIRFADERLFIDRLRVTAQDSVASVSGSLPLDENGEGVIDLDAKANLATLVQYAPADTNISGEGALGLSGRIRGNLTAIDPDLVLTVDDALILAPQIEPGITNLSLRAAVANGAATLESLTANWGAARLNASAQVPLDLVPELPIAIPRRGGAATVHAGIEGLDPAAVPGAPAGLSGRISVNADVAAERPDLAAVSGAVTFPDLQVGFNGLTLEQKGTSTIRIADETVTVEQFDLAGTVGTITATGTVGLQEPRPIDARVQGDLNVAAVSLFTDAARMEGRSTLEITAKGTAAAPDVNGFVTLDDANIVVDEPTIAAEGVDARIQLAGDRIELTSLTGELNGGVLNGSGIVSIAGGELRDVNLQITTDDFAFDAPLELRSLSDASIRVSKQGEEFVVDGQVTIEEGGLTGDINFDSGILAAVTARRQLDLTEERNPLLERIRLNVNVDTAQPILIDNNLAQAEITTDLRVLGTPYETGLSGLITLVEGSVITLNERRYEVERGIITFIDERRIFPSFDLRLNTKAGNYDVTLAVNGTPGETETALTSDPTLPEPDIMALLVTGRTLDDMRGEEGDIAREQVLSYLGGRVGSQLGRGIQRATGLSEVRLEPNLIANETNPGARLTVGQDLTDQLGLVYSTNLADSSDQIWVAEYDLTRRFQTRAVRQSDASYRFDFRHDVRFGGTPAPQRVLRVRPQIVGIGVTGDATAQEAEVRKLLGAKEGGSYDFFKVREGVRRVERFYQEQGYLQSRVRLQRTVTGQEAKLALNVRRGPTVEIAFEGITPPGKIREQVEEQWHRGVFDAQRGEDGVEALRAWLMGEQYLAPTVSFEVQDVGADRRRVVFRGDPGVRYQKVLLVFNGAVGVPASELDAIVQEQELERQLFTDPLVVTELLTRYYREQGFLSAEIDTPRYEYEGTTARVVLDVREGERFTIERVTTDGNAVIPTSTLIAELPTVAGEPYLPATAERALERLRQLYWARGYNDMRSDYELTVDRVRAVVSVAFTIREGLRSVVADVTIGGNDETSERLVREQMELKPDETLDLGLLGRSRRNLYDTGAFSVVDITRTDANPATPEVPPAVSSEPASQTPQQEVAADKPVNLNVQVREVQPYQMAYGASFDTERGLGGILDLSNHNSLGKARVVGIRSRYDSQLRELRGYMSQPSLKYFPLQTIGSVYIREERNPVTDVTEALNIDRWGASIQQERKLGNNYVWNYGYRYEQVHSFDPRPGGTLDETVTVSPLTSTFTREARDEVLDASTGSFTSHAFSFSPSWLGSDLPYLKYYGQYFRYFPLQSPRRKRFTNEIIRPRLVFATGVRVGLAKALDDEMPISERFLAGGSTTLRGFAQNSVGPIGADGIPLGGEGLFVINNELRFPLISIVDGVGFLDIGNVFAKVNDFDVTDLRESAGVGLRLRTPWFLIRGDYGFALDARDGERRSRFFFSIGQAF